LTNNCELNHIKMINVKEAADASKFRLYNLIVEIYLKQLFGLYPSL